MDASISNIIWQGILLIILIVISAFLSAFEAAISSLSEIKLKCYYQNNENKIGFKVLNMYLQNFGITISSILTGNNLVAVAASTLSTLFFNNICLLTNVADPIALAAGLSTGIITFLLLIFGEYIPKSFGRYNIKFLVKTLYIGIIFYYLFWPISWVLNFLINRKNKIEKMSESELRMLVNQIKDDGLIESDKAFLINCAIKFDQKRVKDILTPLKFVKKINIEMSYDEIKQEFLQTKYSRLPVVKKKKFIGMITFKDFFSNAKNKHFKIESLIKQILVFSQYLKLDDALRQMQINKCHLALVKAKNDSEKIIGLISLENIIECLVGKIYDEDDDELKIMEINDHTYHISYDLNARKFFQKLFGERNQFWLSINEDINMHQWILNEFNIKKINRQIYENEILKIIIDEKNKQKFILELKK